MVSIEDEEDEEIYDEIPEDFEFHNEDNEKKKKDLVDKEFRIFQSFREKENPEPRYQQHE